MKPLKKQSMVFRDLIAIQPIPVMNGKPKPAFRFAAKAVLLQLMRYVKDDGSCFCSYTDIINVVGCSRPMLTKIKNYWEREGILTWTKGIANQFERKANTYQFHEEVLRKRLKAEVARESDTFPKQDEAAQETFEPARKTLDGCSGNVEGVARESYTLPIKEYSNGSKPREKATEAKTDLVVFSSQSKKKIDGSKSDSNVLTSPRSGTANTASSANKKIESRMAVLEQKMIDELDKSRSGQRIDYSQYDAFKNEYEKLERQLLGVEEEL